MAYDKDNIFAKTLRGEIPSTKIYEDALTFAFLDIMPQARGHTLVIPKCEAESLLDLPTQFAAPLLLATQKIARAVKAVVEAPGIMIAQLSGPAAGQTVLHVHFHIIPRWDGVDLGFHERAKAVPGELEALAAKIRERLRAQS